MKKTGLVDSRDIRRDSAIQFMDMVLFAVKGVIIHSPLAYANLRKEDIRALEGSIMALYGCVFPFLEEETLKEGKELKRKINPESLRVWEADKDGKEKRLYYIESLMELYDWCMKQLKWLGGLPEMTGIGITPESSEDNLTEPSTKKEVGE